MDAVVTVCGSAAGEECPLGLGRAFLLIGVAGSGVMGAALSDASTAIVLLANAIATGCILYVIITTLAPISGVYLNPAVTLAFWLRGRLKPARPVDLLSRKSVVALYAVGRHI